MRIFPRYLLLLALLLPLAQAQAASRLAREAIDDVRKRIAARNCAGAVARLNEGLKAAYPEVALLAGSMYEHGICVKASWDKALVLYTQAYQGGLPEAAQRLAAGFADPARGPDVAAALWWDLRERGTSRYVSCAVPRGAEQDPDRFVAALSSWEPHKLAVCNYIVGVMSSITADVKYPDEAAAWDMRGEVTLRFLPAVPRIELKNGAAGFRLFGWLDGDSRFNQEAGKVAAGFEATLRDAANRALRRYPQPAGIPADEQVMVDFVFTL